MDNLRSESCDMLFQEGLAGVRLDAAVLEPAIELVVLPATIETDHGPHVVVVSEQIHLGWPYDVESRQLIGPVPHGHHGALAPRSNLRLYRCRVRHRSFNDVLDSPMGPLPRPHRGQALRDELILVESHRPPLADHRTLRARLRRVQCFGLPVFRMRRHRVRPRPSGEAGSHPGRSPDTRR